MGLVLCNSGSNNIVVHIISNRSGSSRSSDFEITWCIINNCSLNCTPLSSVRITYPRVQAVDKISKQTDF